jgi:predicted small integral membrane protein
MISLPPPWMYWTMPTLLFLGAIVLLLVVLTLWDRKDPGYAREGLLPIATTRGDRVFMGILLLGAIFCGWLYVFGQTAAWSVLLLGVVAMGASVNLL